MRFKLIVAKLFVAVIAVQLIVGCASWRRDWGWCQVDYSKNYEDGTQRKEGTFERFSLNQEFDWLYYYKGGAKKASGEYYLDYQDGLWTYWYKDGEKKLQGLYADRRRTGVWNYYHANGRLNARGGMHLGRDHGEWTYWDERGNLDRRGHYSLASRFIDGRTGTPTAV